MRIDPKGGSHLRILMAADVPRKREAGVAGVLLNHAHELRKRGHEVECWFLEDVLEPKKWRNRFVSLIFALRVAKRIREMREKYDVVNLHIPTGCVIGVWRRLHGRRDTPPCVFTMQGIIARYRYIMRREEDKGRAWHFGWKNRVWHRLYHETMHSIAIRTADYGVASNREAWTYAELVYDRDPGRLWYVPNGTEERFFLKRDYTARELLRLLYVGTWLDRKGIYYLVDAFRALIQREMPVDLTIAGCLTSAEEVKAFFSAEVRNRLHVIPFVKWEDMPALYAAHDIFVFPSLMEGMPLSLLEAMATGMPVVTTETCGMADVVENGFNGLTAPPADGFGLVEGVERLCGSVGLRERLGREAQQTMRNYTWERVTQRLEAVLSYAVRQEAVK
jgi:glycosyltransferase involved in cell wall biosynthesis